MLPFLTAFDSISTNSGSIDPLGALQNYVALADLLLPGVTTITSRSRYLSMLCAALKNIENHRRFSPGPSGVAERRKAVEPFERLWAVACVAAREQQHGRAADRLLGITYAADALRSFATDDPAGGDGTVVVVELAPPTLVGWPMSFNSAEILPLVTPGTLASGSSSAATWQPDSAKSSSDPGD